MFAEIDRLTRVEEKYNNLCNVLNEQTSEIQRLRGALERLESLCETEQDISTIVVSEIIALAKQEDSDGR